MSTKRKSLGTPKNNALKKVSQQNNSGSNTKPGAKKRRSLTQPESDEETNEYGLEDANISEDEEGGTRVGDIYIPPPVAPYCSTESKGPRLIIKKIENNNFKSYAGLVVLGPFHHCFTAIIGPNGSGKSNVIDSMLFVFGYRANKIRCKKISTLLHNSAKHPNITQCSVAVHFWQVIDKIDGSCEEVSNSEIIVERTAYRDNTSFYTINGRRVQFKQVSQLLKQHGVDLDHNRFLILQGEVESIAMMKAKGASENESGMLEYLEDIVGTTRYKKPLVQIHDRVERLTEERTEKHNRCKLAEREMKDLEQPYNDAIEYLRKENEHTYDKNLLLQKNIHEKTKELETYKKEHEEVANALKQHDEIEEALTKERKQKEAQIKEEMANYDKLCKNRDEMEKQLEKATSNYSEVQETMLGTNNRRKQNKTQVEKFGKELVELRKVPDKNAKEIAECEAKVEKLTQQKSELEEELQRNYLLLAEKTKPLVEKREKLENELVDLKRSVDEAKSELTVSESELKILNHDSTAETRKYESLKTSYEDSQSSLQEKLNKVKELKELLPQLYINIKTVTNQLEQLRQQDEQKRAKLVQLRLEINERTASIQNLRSNNKVLDFIMRQKNEGKIPGVLGRLGDLGAIDAKYDVAISTACGRLDNVVVDTVNTAQACIEALKTFDVGRASFIALEKVKHLENYSGKIKTPENAPRLYDLVRVEDERVLPAFYFALRNTLVATDLDQATRIAYGAKRHRVATLNGDMIEVSGTMSGGGRTQIRGKMGTKVQTKTKVSANTSMLSQKALENLQIEAEELQSSINYNQEEQGRLERELQQLKQSVQNTEADIQKLCITIKSLEQQLPRILKQLEEQKERMLKTTSDANKVKSLEAEIERKRQNLVRSEKASNEIEVKVTEIKQSIDNIHGDDVKGVQTKITNTANQIKKLNANISKLKVAVSTSERNVVKLEKQVQSLQNEILKCESDLKELNERRTKYDDETVELTEKITEAKAEIAKIKTESSSAQKEILLIQKKVSDSKLKRVEIEQKLQTVTGKLNGIKEKIPHLRDQLKPLSLNEIPGDSAPQEPLRTYTAEELDALNLLELEYKCVVLAELLQKKPNLSYIEEYIGKRDIYFERVKVLEDITSKRNEMRTLYDDVRKKRHQEFMQSFQIITRKLKEMYQMITQGGDAELELCDSMDPFTEGVTFSVRPPKKSWKNISNLSGGEKTLSSLALVFALHYYKPSPLYFMDEIDAALDFKNISIVAHYIKERTKNAQFIIISLRSNMFELCDFIVGIYKMDDCTETLTIKNTPTVLKPIQQVQADGGTQQQSTQNDKTSTYVQRAEFVSPQIHTGNEENSPPKTNPIRESSFMPNCESTVVHNRNNNASATCNGEIIPETQNTDIVNTDPSCANNNSITDAFFKKPFPPPPLKDT